jgi:hypothetical protein
MFLDDQEGASEGHREREELPTGVITVLTKCYSSSCGDGMPCFSYACPRRVCNIDCLRLKCGLSTYRSQGNSILAPALGQPEPPQETVCVVHLLECLKLGKHLLLEGGLDQDCQGGGPWLTTRE